MLENNKQENLKMTEEKKILERREQLKTILKEEVMTSAEAAEFLGISRARLSQISGTEDENKLIRPLKKLGRDSLFYLEDLKKLRIELEEKRKKYRPYDSQ